MPRRPKTNVTMQTAIKTILTLRTTPTWKALPGILREELGGAIDVYLGRILGAGVAAPATKITRRAARKTASRVPNGIAKPRRVAQRSRGVNQPTA